LFLISKPPPPTTAEPSTASKIFKSEIIMSLS